MKQLTLFGEEEEKKLIGLKEARDWASQYLNRKVTISNISYLLQYGRIQKYGNSGNPLIDWEELKAYYDAFNKEEQWKKQLGSDLNWHLSFVEYKESERTKHIHRIHPYKGKFIPQLVEYFLDEHTDEFKKEIYFREGDIVLDPFCGSGTTLIQANELNINAIGIDISLFNAMISNVKVKKHNLDLLNEAICNITIKLEEFLATKKYITFEEDLISHLAKFNYKYFPSPEYKKQVRSGEIDEQKYAIEKEKEFLYIYYVLIKKYQIKIK